MDDAIPLPTAPDDLTPAWLTAVLRATGVLHRGTVVAFRSDIIGEDRGFTGVVARLRIRYDDAARTEPSPPSLIAKFPMAERSTSSTYSGLRRDPETARRHYERAARETRFYQEIAPISPIPVPRLFHAAADDGRVLLLVQDLAGARPGDALDGCSPADAAHVIDAIAPFHARWWAGLAPDALPWLPAWVGDVDGRQERYNRHVGPFLERFGHALPPAIRDLVVRLQTRYAAVLAEVAQAPATIIHADLHLDNVVFNPPGVAPPTVILDWQGVCRGPAAVDVALFLFGSLDVEPRRAVEADLLRRYRALLVEHGVAGYPLARLRDDCRLALLWQLAGTVGWLATADLDRLTGRERTLVDAAIGDGRLVAALLDYDVAALVRS